MTKQPLYRVGERIEKYTGDYQLDGEIRAVLETRAGKLRYVVEHGQGFLHIYNETQLRRPLSIPLPPLPENEK